MSQIIQIILLDIYVFWLRANDITDTYHTVPYMIMHKINWHQNVKRSINWTS